ncbi:MAG: S-layer homology domain-containing protein [Patescibacteria group bacterium]|nr:S-layer homology domain-containing protein [Patescibacteria group bacterium]
MNRKVFHFLEILGGIIIGASIMVAVYIMLPDHLKAEIPVFHSGPLEADITIQSVKLTKVADSDRYKDYSHYVADVTVKNLGRPMKEASMTLSSGEQRYAVKVSPEQHQFTLGYDDEVVLRGYNVYVDKKHNGEMITFRVDLDNEEDANPENNDFTKGVVDFENEGLKDLYITQVDGGRISLTLPVNLGEDFDYYLLHSRNASAFPDKVYDYREYVLEDDVLSYYTGSFKMSDLEILKRFDTAGIDPLNPSVSFSPDALKDPFSHVFALKAVKKDKTIYAFSNVLVLPVQSKLNRAEFAKLIVEWLGLEVEKGGNSYYTDIDKDEWYADYLQTLLNNGYITLSKNYRPADQITRGEVAQVLVEALDLPFEKEGEGVHFADVPRTHSAYYAVEALYAHGYLKNFGPSFKPNTPATRAFLKFFTN